MKVTIITINFNNKFGLEETIRSVTGQTYNIIEYIIIDGGSTDGSMDVVNANEEKISYWMSEKDEGVYDAMNKGIKRATGDYLLFINSGDYLYNEGVISDLIQRVDDSKDLIFGDIYLKLPSGEMLKKVYPERLSFNFFFHHESLPHCATLIRRSLFDKIGLYNEGFKIISDWEFWLKAIFLHQASYKKVDQIISVFNLEGISSSEVNNPIIKAEKELTYRTYFSDLVPDYQNFENERQNFNTFKRRLDENIYVRMLRKLKLLKYD